MSVLFGMVEEALLFGVANRLERVDRFDVCDGPATVLSAVLFGQQNRRWKREMQSVWPSRSGCVQFSLPPVAERLGLAMVADQCPKRLETVFSAVLLVLSHLLYWAVKFRQRSGRSGDVCDVSMRRSHTHLDVST